MHEWLMANRESGEQGAQAFGWAGCLCRCVAGVFCGRSGDGVGMLSHAWHQE